MNKGSRLTRSVIAFVLIIVLATSLSYSPRLASVVKSTKTTSQSKVKSKNDILKTNKANSKPSVTKPKPSATKPQAVKPKPVTQVNNKIKGFFWRIISSKATVYLYGSIHVAKSDMYPLEKPVEDAFSKSKNLVVEADITNTESSINSQEKMFYSNGDNIYNHLSDEGKQRVDACAKELGVIMDQCKIIKPWELGSIFLELQLQKLGYSANEGVDEYFLNKAKGNKTILELEGVDYQFNLLSGFSDEEQEKMFLGDVQGLKDAEDTFSKMYDAYKNGDDKTLDLLLNGSYEDESKEIYDKLIMNRNTAMADKIDSYLETEGSYFVVAGAAHFIGDDSVIKFLENKGYKVERIYK